MFLLNSRLGLLRVPYILVIGDREMEDGAVAVRARGGEDLGTVKIDQFIERLQQDLKERK